VSAPASRGDVGIVGFGRCGALAARLLAPGREVLVTDVRDRSREAAEVGVRWGDLQAAAGRGTVLLAVPIRELAHALQAIAPHLAPGALVVDLASVKVRPMEWMAEHLPPAVRRVGTHPLFGPDSARDGGVEGRRIVICAAPGHEAAAAEIEEAARALGLVPLRATAEEHDRAMARSQALVFLLSHALTRAGIEPAAFGTPSEEHLAAAMRLVGRDSQELYEDILRLNPFAQGIATRLEISLHAEVDRLGGAETQGPS